MKKLAIITFFCLMSTLPLFAQSQQLRDTSGVDEERTKWVADALHSIQTIKVGMTRADLMKVFTTEGGMEFKSKTDSHQTYVYRKCPFIKVDVTMAISYPEEDLPTDKIAEISKPYLEWTIAD